ncbi:PepSY domain-containing protein [Micromonospora sp. WMMD1102]|uniref:PepSY-associated TM helix domain-containing protein n=1 Tax=Micromonospora sp. WMMD1102 TaxID=3016105 RepID=UPI00241583BF|nr:PepSY domain-containing protein [Micromonospora sp. WMMD1102]MDG4785005.1 PepSY domain-containing protein [Micromonospora sp. WMMD1102]
MTATETTPAPPAESPSSPARAKKTNWFAAFWRWHFYGSLIVIPVLFCLAVTGMTYMFRAEVDSLAHPGVLKVPVVDGVERTALSAQEAAVRAEFPDRPILSVQDGTGDRATLFVAGLEDGSSTNIYVNPYTATVTGELRQDQLISTWAERIHGDLLIGEDGVGDRIVELGASWAIMLTITGFIIFFLGRRARGGAQAKGKRGARLRGLHAIVGLPVGLGILLLVLSGLPWTGFWGAKAQQVAAQGGSALWGEDPGAESTIRQQIEDTDGQSAPAGWASGNAPQGTSTGSGTPISIDKAVTAAQAQGAPGPYLIMYPEGEKGVFSVMSSQWYNVGNPAESDVSKETTIHVDQYSGEVVGEYGYHDYSAAAKVVSQGIALHEGRRLGTANTILSTLFCLAVIFMCVTGPMMWWTRRTTASGLAAPRAKLPVWGNWTLLGAMAVLGVFLPLFGLSLLIILALDQLLIRRLPALRNFFGTV